jgi:putative resolvase
MKVAISKASEILGVSCHTLRRWESIGKIESERTAKGHRRYDIGKLTHCKRSPDASSAKRSIAYARVSSHDQKDDLTRQIQRLEMFCAANGWVFEIISDLGSGMNYNKRGLKRLLEAIDQKQIGRLVLTHKDRLLRFGSELIFALCEARGIEIVIMNQGGEPSFEEELAQDVLEIITVFSARLYGSRSRKNKELISNIKRAAEAVHA